MLRVSERAGSRSLAQDELTKIQYPSAYSQLQACNRHGNVFNVPSLISLMALTLLAFEPSRCFADNFDVKKNPKIMSLLSG